MGLSQKKAGLASGIGPNGAIPINLNHDLSVNQELSGLSRINNVRDCRPDELEAFSVSIAEAIRDEVDAYIEKEWQVSFLFARRLRTVLSKDANEDNIFLAFKAFFGVLSNAEFTNYGYRHVRGSLV